MDKIVKLEWEGIEKGDKVIKSGYFIKVMNRYFPISLEEGNYMTKEDNKIISEEEVNLNILGKFK